MHIEIPEYSLQFTQPSYYFLFFNILIFLYLLIRLCSFFFFFNDTATTEIYTLSLHDALPIWFLNEWEAFKKVISRRNIRRRITIPLTLSNLKLLRRITRTENILHRNFT